MSPESVGRWFCILWIGQAIVYDLLVFFVWKQPTATISHHLREWANWTPLILLPLGGLLWHLWGVARGRGWGTPADWACIAVLIVGALLYALIGIGRMPDLGPPTHAP